MSSSLTRRLEKLEEEVRREQASKKRWRLFWIDPETGIRQDALKYGSDE
jgi:hypothetical protein